ncbi:MAG: ABC transporter substrate-binding protein [Sphingobacteriia bacterium]|nr:ABC transporter substrate-binding protein [Sphingobacteriia bacterium]
MLKKIFLASVLVVSCLNPAMAKFVDSKNAKEFVEQLSHDTLVIITNASLNDEKKFNMLCNKFISNVDTNWISKFVLGAHYRKLNDVQKKEFAELYKDFLVNYYVPKFKQFNEDVIKILGVHELGDYRFKVSTIIDRKKDFDVKVDYLVKPSENGDPKIYDIVAEDISMVTTHRSEFTSVISQKGYDGMVSYLRQKIDSQVKNRAVKS